MVGFLLATRDAVAGIGLLFVLLALVAFGVAVWLASRGAWIAAAACAAIGVVILVVAPW
jgi:hypothetical protein